MKDVRFFIALQRALSCSSGDLSLSHIDGLFFNHIIVVSKFSDDKYVFSLNNTSRTAMSHSPPWVIFGTFFATFLF